MAITDRPVVVGPTPPAVVPLTVRFPGLIGTEPNFATQLVALVGGVAARGHTINLPVGGGLRSTQRQAELRVINGCPDIHTSPASSCEVPTAIPGRSNHEKGLAYDIGGTTAAKRVAKEIAGQYGLHFPVRGEDWHVEPINPGSPVTVPAPTIPDGWHVINDLDEYLRVFGLDPANQTELSRALTDAFQPGRFMTDGAGNIERVDGSALGGGQINIGPISIPSPGTIIEKLDPFGAAKDMVELIRAFFRIITDPDLWLRLLAILAGGVGVVLGVVIILRDLGAAPIPIPSLTKA